MVIGKGELCCGCTACESICGKQAIIMSPNKKGFLEPVVDLEKCVQCGLCNTVCPFENKPDKVSDAQHEKVCAAKRIDVELQKSSQSGGAFAGLAETFLKNDGIVYGVKLDDELKAVYTRIEDVKKLSKLKGSKYVQACVGNTYCMVEMDLKNGKSVLFSGTPCHVYGLLSYLKARRINAERLMTVDIVCHGVPSPKLYEDEKKLIAEFHGNKKIKGFNFRDKSFGWGSSYVEVKIGKKFIIDNDYTKLFYSHLALRDSCYTCPFADKNRVSDITIADCWGIEKVHPEFWDRNGCSLVICNSVKGNMFWSSVEEQFYICELTLESVLQPNMQHPTERPDETDLFWKDYHKFGYEYVLRKYCDGQPEASYERIHSNQYLKRLLRKLDAVYHRVFITK